MSFLQIDEQHRPAIVFTLVGEPTDEQFQGYLDAVCAFLYEPTPLAFVNDLGDGATLLPPHRKMLATFLDEHRGRFESHCLGSYLVIRRGWQRFLVSSVMLLTMLPGRFSTVPSVADALDQIGIARAGAPGPGRP